MKQKRNGGNINNVGSVNNNRDGSNDPYENNQRIDTGGGDYHQMFEDDASYNKFSPKGNQKLNKGSKFKVTEERNFNRQGSKKGIPSTQFMTNKLTFGAATNSVS